jgi:aspartate carbamoyltransferase catalytic subunit
VALRRQRQMCIRDRSIILDQVENGVAVRMAVIYLLASKIGR